VRIRVGHLYPDYLNIYADRGNIAVLAERARLRGHELDVQAIGMRDAVPAREIDLFYIGGGQDREQALVAHDLVAKADVLRESVEDDAAFLAVCGGYQLLGRFYRDVAGEDQPGIALLPLQTIAGARRMIGDVLLDCAWAGETLAGFENHAGRTLLDAAAAPLGHVVAGFGNDGASREEGCRYRRVYGTYLHGPLLPRNPWFADRLLAEALAHADGARDPVELAPLEDGLEREAHAVSAARARSRGGKF
jgi:CobQ-like glutamine amidotransferase family enzyme